MKEQLHFRSILVAVDLSAISDRVLSRCARLPLADNAHVSVIHVVPEKLPHDAQARASHDARKILVSEVEHLRTALPRGVTVETTLKVGTGAREIARAAIASQAELVVIGRGGSRAVRDVFLGSTAEQLLRMTRLPVLAVRLPARTTYKRPAIALAFDDAAADSLEVAKRVFAATSPRITVIHAVDTPYHGIAYPSLAREEAADFDNELELQAGRKMAKWFARSAASGPNLSGELRWKPHVRTGSARLVIAKAVQRAGTDLLVLGTAGHTGIAQLLLGTVAGDVLREVPCDVLLVPPRTSKRTRRRS